MSLGLWGRLTVIGIGSSAVLLALVLVVCFVHPSCLGFRCLERDPDKKKKSLKEVVIQDNGLVKKAETPTQGYWIRKPECVPCEAGLGWPEEGHKWNEGKINLKCSPFSVTPSLTKEDKPAGPQLKLKLSYNPLTSDGTMGRLTVHLMEALSLPYREYFNSLDPYVVLDILNSKWSLQKTERVVHSVQSRVVRHSYNPKFDQVFLFDVKKSELKDWCLKFTVFDRDRLTKRNPICEKRIYIRDVRNLAVDPEVEIVEDLHQMKRSNGQLLFGISYLPTAQRLSISIMKASSLKYLSVAPSLREFYPYVRILMLGVRGKCIKKKKTSFRRGEENPIFNETLTFDLPLSNLEQAAFLVLLCSKVLGKRLSSDGSVTDPDAEVAPKDSKDNVLGAVVVGRNVKCSKAREHWLTVMQNPRQIISVWHHLK